MKTSEGSLERSQIIQAAYLIIWRIFVYNLREFFGACEISPGRCHLGVWEGVRVGSDKGLGMEWTGEWRGQRDLIMIDKPGGFSVHHERELTGRAKRRRFEWSHATFVNTNVNIRKRIQNELVWPAKECHTLPSTKDTVDTLMRIRKSYHSIYLLVSPVNCQ